MPLDPGNRTERQWIDETMQTIRTAAHRKKLRPSALYELARRIEDHAELIARNRDGSEHVDR